MRSNRMRVLALCVVLFVAAQAAMRGQGRRATTPGPAPAPASFDVMEKSIEELRRAMEAREVTSRQLVDSFLARIDAYDKQGPALNAITVVNPNAREAADALDAERASGRTRGPLHGIPVLVKD